MADETPKIQHWRAFDDDWFRRHQSLLLRLANAPIVGQRLRRALGLKRGLPVTILTPNAAHYRQDDHQSVGVFYSGPVLSRRIYEAYKPIWWGLHYYDEVFADRFAPELSYGFDQLTEYTGQGEVQNFDGNIRSDGTTYTAARNGSGTLTYTAIDSRMAVEATRITSSDFTYSRGFLKFNLTSLAAKPVVSSASIKLAGDAVFGASLFSLNIYQAYMSDSATTLQYSDWTSTTNSSGAVEYGSTYLSGFQIDDYEVITVGSAGRSLISDEASGYLPIVLRHQRDTAGNNATSESYLLIHAADSSADLPPILEVTYSRGVYPAGLTLTTGYGLPTLSQSVPALLPAGIASTLTFGLPTISGALQTVSPASKASTVTIGAPSIAVPAVISPVGIASTLTFGDARNATLQPPSILGSATMGEAFVYRAPNQLIRPTPLASTLTIGQPTAELVAWPLDAGTIPSTSRVGVPSIAIPYPDGILHTGPYIARIIDQPIEYGYTLYEFEDGGSSVNVQPCGVRRWVLSYEGLTEEELGQLTSHWFAMRGRTSTFYWYHRRDEYAYLVRYVSMEIPARARRWNNQVTVTLEGLV
jgi:hypothetical protein